MNNKTDNRIYVGNLSVLVDEMELTTTLNVYGTVLSTDIKFSENSRSRRCYAVVEMATREDANAVIEKLNGNVFGGRVLKIRKF